MEGRKGGREGSDHSMAEISRWVYNSSPYVLKAREDKHVPEAVDGQHWQVLLPLAQVVKGVGKGHPIRCHRVDCPCSHVMIQ